MAAGNIVLGADRGTGDFAGRAWSGDDSYIEVLAMWLESSTTHVVAIINCSCVTPQRWICELLPGTSETLKCYLNSSVTFRMSSMPAVANLIRYLLARSRFRYQM